MNGYDIDIGGETQKNSIACDLKEIEFISPKNALESSFIMGVNVRGLSKFCWLMGM